MAVFNELKSVVWSAADEILRDSVPRNEYGDHILPFLVLRRFECMIADKREKILDYIESNTDKLEDMEEGNREFHIKTKFSVPLYNSSRLTLTNIAGDSDSIFKAMETYLTSFSSKIRLIWERFKFMDSLKTEEDAGILHSMIDKFSEFDLSPGRVGAEGMGDIFEHLMYLSFTGSAKEAGEFYTPRDVIEMMVEILFASDDTGLQGDFPARSVYDPTAGTGGMLLTAKHHLEHLNEDVEVSLYGQEKMFKSWALGTSDILIQSDPEDEFAADAIVYGNTLTEDAYPDRTFDYILANPPYGSKWKNEQDVVKKEAAKPGSRFSHGLPDVGDGQMLFMSHIVHKLTPAHGETGGGRAAVVSDGSPLFTGGPESGPDSIRAWILDPENDYLDAIIALPTSMFFNTGIATYVWIFDKNKEAHRKGQIQLINATDIWSPVKKTMGQKRRDLSSLDQKKIVEAYAAFEDSDISYICTSDDLGFRDVPVVRPLKLVTSVTEETVQAAMSHNDITEDYREVIEGLDGVEFADIFTVLKKELRAHKLRNTAGIRKHIALSVGVHEDDAPVALDEKGNKLTDSSSKMVERIPLTEDIDEHMEREVLPFVPNAEWDKDEAKTGYEIPFSRIFYQPEDTRTTEEIDQNIERLMNEMFAQFQEVKE